MTESTATMLAPIEFAFLCWFIAPSGQLLSCTDRSCLLRPDCVAGDDYCVLYDFDASRERILDRDLRVKNDQDAIDDGRQGHEPPLWPAGSRMPPPRGCGDRSYAVSPSHLSAAPRPASRSSSRKSQSRLSALAVGRAGCSASAEI